MVLERTLPLLQQEEEEFGAKERIHGDTTERKNTEKTRNKIEGKRRGCSFWVGYSVTIHLEQGNAETWSTQKREALIQHGTQETQEQQGRHSITDKH